MSEINVADLKATLTLESAGFQEQAESAAEALAAITAASGAVDTALSSTSDSAQAAGSAVAAGAAEGGEAVQSLSDRFGEAADKAGELASGGVGALSDGLGSLKGIIGQASSEFGELVGHLGEVTEKAAEALGEGGLGALGGVLTAGVGAMVALGVEGGHLVTELTQIAAATGLTIEEADRLSLAFEDAGGNAQVLVRAGGMIDQAMQAYTVSMEKGTEVTGKARILTHDLGISLEEGATSGDVFSKALETLAAKYADPTTKQAALQEAVSLFGARMAGQILPVIENYGQLMEKSGTQSGILASGLEDAQQKSIRFNSALTDLKVAAESFGLKSLPIVTDGLGLLTKSLSGWTEMISLAKGPVDMLGDGVSWLGDQFGLGGDGAVDYAKHLKELGETEAKDVAPAVEHVTDSFRAHRDAASAIDSQIADLNKEMGETHTVTVKVADATKSHTTELKSQKTAIDEAKLGINQHKLGLDENKESLNQQIQGIDNQIKSLQAQKTAVGNSAAEVTNHTVKTKENAGAVAAHNQAVTDNKLALDRQIQGLQASKQNLELQKQGVDHSEASLRLQTEALGLSSSALQIQGDKLKEHSSTYTTTTGNAAAFNDALKTERDELANVKSHLGTSADSLKEWGVVVRGIDDDAKGFNSTLSAMTSALDKYKNVPTQELLLLEAAQAKVNVAITDYRVELDKSGTSSDAHLKSLEGEKKTIDDQIASLKAHREAGIADTKAIDAAKLSADGMAKSEWELNGAIDAAGNHMSQQAAQALDDFVKVQAAINSLWVNFPSYAPPIGAQPPSGPMPLPDPGFGFTPFVNTHAAGGRNLPGGMSWVGENGPEIINVPQGSDIYSNGDSRQMGAGGVEVHIHGDINAYDPAQARAAAADAGWAITAAYRSRGTVRAHG